MTERVCAISYGDMIKTNKTKGNAILQEQFLKLLKTQGFATFINPKIGSDIMDDAYGVWERYFASSNPVKEMNHYGEKLKVCETPEVGHFPFGSESKSKDSCNINRMEYYQYRTGDEYSIPVGSGIDFSPALRLARLGNAMAREILAYLQSKCDAPLMEDISNRVDVDKVSLFRALHYPIEENVKDVPVGDDGYVERIGLHCDKSLLTLVYSPKGGGYSVQLNSGEIVNITLPEGAVLVQVGDALHNVSGGMFRAAPHCVKVKPESLDKPRYSMAQFIHLGWGEKIHKDGTTTSMLMNSYFYKKKLPFKAPTA